MTTPKRLAESKGNWPAIELCQIQNGGELTFLLIDGRHRLEASKINKAQTIKAHIKNYANGEEVARASIEANIRHGLLPQPNKKKDYCIWLYNHDHQDDMEGIAAIVGLNRQAVEDIIEQYLEGDEEEEEVIERSATERLVDYLVKYITTLAKDKKVSIVEVSEEMKTYISKMEDKKRINATRFMSYVCRILEPFLQVEQ